MRTIEIQRLLRLLEAYHKESGSDNAHRLIQEILGTDPGPRKAGRKPKYSREMQEQIRSMYRQGMTMRHISEQTGCSLGYIQRQISSRQEERNQESTADEYENLTLF